MNKRILLFLFDSNYPYHIILFIKKAPCITQSTLIIHRVFHIKKVYTIHSSHKISHFHLLFRQVQILSVITIPEY